MRRREFIVLFGGAIAAWSRESCAQEPLREVGFFHIGSPGPFQSLVTAFRKGLNKTGFIEQQNVRIEYRWAENRHDQMPVLLNELVRRRVGVLAAFGGAPSALAAKEATATIPIVFLMGGDPVQAGVVTSLNHPDANVTGVSFLTEGLETKRLGLLHELLPKALVFGALIDPSFSAAEQQIKDLQQATNNLGVRAIVVKPKNENDFERIFSELSRHRVDALLVCASPFFNNHRERLVTLAADNKVPTMYELREFAAAGGLVSYGTSITDAAQQVGIYVGSILNGKKPAELPVMQSTKFQLVINLRSAKALQLEVPPMLIARADEVIE
jgi:putative ABC transport system substrate-binding protein